MTRAHIYSDKVWRELICDSILTQENTIQTNEKGLQLKYLKSDNNSDKLKGFIIPLVILIIYFIRFKTLN